MSERNCSATENSESATQVGPGKHFGPIHVDVLAVDANAEEVTFQAAQTNGYPVKVRCKWTQDNVWPKCPSTLDSDFKRLPKVGDSGRLYVSRKLAGGHGLAVNIKWPDDLGVQSPDDYRPLKLWPLEIHMRAIEQVTGGPAIERWLDLLDPNFVQQDQPLRLLRSSVTLRASQKAFARFALEFPDLAPLHHAHAVLKSRSATARDKAEAWTTVANWQDAIGGRKDLTEAHSILDAISKL